MADDAPISVDNPSDLERAREFARTSVVGKTS